MITLEIQDTWNEFTTYKVSGELEGRIEVQFDDNQFNGKILFSNDDEDCEETNWTPVTDKEIYETIKAQALQDYHKGPAE